MSVKLYELTSDFADLFDRFNEISEWEPDTDADGNPIDDDGNVIENVVRYKEAMLTAWFDTLQGIEEEFELKAENTALYIKNLLAEVNAFKNEKKNLERRIKNKIRQAENLTSYLFNQMTAINREKIDRPKVLLRIKTNPESTVIENEKEFIDWAEKSGYNNLLKYPDPEPKKLDIKNLIRKNVDVPFAHLERVKKLEIK